MGGGGAVGIWLSKDERWCGRPERGHWSTEGRMSPRGHMARAAL